MLKALTLAALMTLSSGLVRADPPLVAAMPAASSAEPSAIGPRFAPVDRYGPADPGDGWGMRLATPGEAAPPSQLDRVGGPPRAADVQAGYLWESHLVQAVAGFSQLDMGPRAATRSLGAPDLLRPPKEDAPGVLGLGLVIRTR